MPNPGTQIGNHVTGDMLIAALPESRPPRHSKLKPAVWREAADLFATHQERVTLRTLCAECGVSHKTAWRIRDILRDAAQVIKEQGGAEAPHHQQKGV